VCTFEMLDRKEVHKVLRMLVRPTFLCPRTRSGATCRFCALWEKPSQHSLVARLDIEYASYVSIATHTRWCYLSVFARSGKNLLNTFGCQIDY
ncbi:6560_t:CDS:1, partial [Ambispora leptoticha]